MGQDLVDFFENKVLPPVGKTAGNNSKSARSAVIIVTAIMIPKFLIGRKELTIRVRHPIPIMIVLVIRARPTFITALGKDTREESVTPEPRFHW